MIRDGRNIAEKPKFFWGITELIPGTRLVQVGDNNGRCVFPASSKNQEVLSSLPAIEKDSDGRIPVTGVLNTLGKSVILFEWIVYHNGL